MHCKNCGKEFCKGLWRENPIFFQVLGMCPTLAVTTKALFGFSMGMATTFVLISSSLVISCIRKLVPPQVRIATFTVIIATFVTCADYFLKANFYTISKELGPYVPLIVVNCIILGRQEAFVSKHSVAESFVDAVGMGIGFSAVLVLLGSIRELLGFGTIFYYKILGEGFENWVIMALPAGAFITLGFLVGLFNWLNSKLTSAHKI
ncbi:MAG: electron transport complex subunit E [Candidatus Omnitrophota bacterium]|nr:MAG: electron transport complex subunit E [Candidatus Omnitrophota bacterium]